MMTAEKAYERLHDQDPEPACREPVERAEGSNDEIRIVEGAG